MTGENHLMDSANKDGERNRRIIGKESDRATNGSCFKWIKDNGSYWISYQENERNSASNPSVDGFEAPFLYLFLH